MKAKPSLFLVASLQHQLDVSLQDFLCLIFVVEGEPRGDESQHEGQSGNEVVERARKNGHKDGTAGDEEWCFGHRRGLETRFIVDALLRQVELFLPSTFLCLGDQKQDDARERYRSCSDTDFEEHAQKSVC